MGRSQRRRRAGKGGGGRGAGKSGGALSSLRGGFKSVARGVAGKGGDKPTSRGGRVMSNVFTVVLLLVAVGLLLRRFGVVHF